MNTMPVYLVRRFVHRIFEFFEDWYVESFHFVAERTLNALRRMDGVFALAVTLRHFFQPLYQDRTLVGYILGFIFRSIRVFLAILFYTAFLALVAALYTVWLVIPLYALYAAVFG